MGYKEILLGLTHVLSNSRYSRKENANYVQRQILRTISAGFLKGCQIISKEEQHVLAFRTQFTVFSVVRIRVGSTFDSVTDLPCSLVKSLNFPVPQFNYLLKEYNAYLPGML